MSRLIAGDTETTGLYSKDGDRIIELALVEITRDSNPRHLHLLFNPEGREISPDAYKVHGISAEDLVDKPTFAECIPQILEFIGDDPLVFHNAPFDLEFIRDEFARANLSWPEPKIIDTLKLAAKEYPGSRHSLDALCIRHGVDLSERKKHGALIDTVLLSRLWIAWKGQSALDLSATQAVSTVVSEEKLRKLITPTIEVPSTVKEKPPAKSWESHFDGLDL
ncbi:MAG: DNA polymerase III subunit epsilon [Acidobacteria bacterium]|nr:DNA polymerase III subunit epsilon [Acidobacteriota bacterium]